MPKLIGSAPNQVSVNGMLGDMAFQSSDAVTVTNVTYTGTLTGGTGVVNIGSGQIVKDASGNLGINATPQAWGANFKGVEGYGNSTFFVSGNSTNGVTVVGNTYHNGTNWVYTTTGAAARHIVGGSVAPHIWSYAASGTGGTTLTWSEGMRMDTNGNIGIGTTSPGGNSVNRVVKAYGSTSGSFQAQSSVTTITVGAGGAEGYVEVTGAYPLQLIVNGSERVRVASDGKVGIGTTGATALLDVNSDTVRVRTSRTPASATATGNAGDICWDANYVYVCTATNTWKRAALSTW